MFTLGFTSKVIECHTAQKATTSKDLQSTFASVMAVLQVAVVTSEQKNKIETTINPGEPVWYIEVA